MGRGHHRRAVFRERADVALLDGATHDVIALALPGHGASKARPALRSFDEVTAVVAVLPGAAHIAPLEIPDAINAELRSFLS